MGPRQLELFGQFLCLWGFASIIIGMAVSILRGPKHIDSSVFWFAVMIIGSVCATCGGILWLLVSFRASN